MILESLMNWNPEAVDDVEYDLLITSCAREGRSVNFARNFEGGAKKKISILFDGASDAVVAEYKELGFEIAEFSSFEDYIFKVLSDLDQSLSILVDVSCMSRHAMAVVLAKVSSLSVPSVRLRVNYTIARYSVPPTDIGANESIEAVHACFSGWSYADSKPTSLILGLGYEPFKAEGASEFFEPYDQWVFVPDSPVEEYLPVVISNNQELISRSGATSKAIYYRVDDPEMTFGQLEQVVSLLMQTTNPVLMPFGPKILFFLCLIQSLCHSEVGVWCVTGNHSGESNSGEASDYSCGVECVFVQFSEVAD
jgi:hypothetical protein